MTLQKLECNKCKRVQYVRSKRGSSKNHFICRDCKNKDKVLTYNDLTRNPNPELSAKIGPSNSLPNFLEKLANERLKNENKPEPPKEDSNEIKA